MACRPIGSIHAHIHRISYVFELPTVRMTVTAGERLAKDLKSIKSGCFSAVKQGVGRRRSPRAMRVRTTIVRPRL